MMGSGTISTNGFKISEAGQKQNESIWNRFKSLARLNTQFRIKESFKLLFAIKVKKIWW